ncbi:DNA repair metallo-beta-lactamase family protein [Wolffia australiana]
MERGLIAVDRWNEESQAYFLTHLHADHTRGLSSDWSRGVLFCSPISAALFPSRFPGFDLSLLQVLEIGRPRSLKLASRSDGQDLSVRVTAIDSCHCPGSVMFLFQGDLGCVLYSGDFRWEPTNEQAWRAKKTLLRVLGGDAVDLLHLDNTFCNPAFDFPPRDVAARQVIDIVNRHPDHEIVIGVDTLGKEDLLVQISQAFNTKVWVWPERLETMHLLGLNGMFTTQTAQTRIRAIPRYSFSAATLVALDSLHPTLGVMPSGLPWSPRPHDYYAAPHRLIHTVHFSAHSCFREIADFVRLLRPAKLAGTVPSSSCYLNPWHFFSHLCQPHSESTSPKHPSKKRKSTVRPRISESRD